MPGLVPTERTLRVSETFNKPFLIKAFVAPAALSFLTIAGSRLSLSLLESAADSSDLVAVRVAYIGGIEV